MKKILFQGDSITEAGRSVKNDFNGGYGFATFVTGILGADYPGKYTFVNRGVGGNRIADILARNREDVIEQKPDYLSLLAGVNDVWYYIDKPGGFDGEKFTETYSVLLEEIRALLPNTKIMLLEPFVVKGSNTSSSENTEKYLNFRKGTEQCAECVMRLSENYSCKFIPLAHIIDAAVNSAPSECFTLDGIHPTSAGHYLIAKEWLKAFKELEINVG